MGLTSAIIFSHIPDFCLPGTESDIDSSSVTSHRSTRGLDRKIRRILVIDDEKLVADSLAEILRRFHFDAIAFYSGEDAIEFAREQCPDIVLSDVMMPQINGIETVLKIQELCPNTRVLLLSGHAATADVLRNAESEGHRFELLAKPIHPEELLRRLQ